MTENNKEQHVAVDAKWKAAIAEANAAFDPFFALPLFRLWRIEKEQIDAGDTQTQ